MPAENRRPRSVFRLPSTLHFTKLIPYFGSHAPRRWEWHYQSVGVTLPDAGSVVTKAWESRFHALEGRGTSGVGFKARCPADNKPQNMRLIRRKKLPLQK